MSMTEMTTETTQTAGYLLLTAAAFRATDYAAARLLLATRRHLTDEMPFATWTHADALADVLIRPRTLPDMEAR